MFKEQDQSAKNPPPLSLVAPDLARWFQTNRRLMPWREERTPYRIWISEVMLQQTQVATVIPYFDRFIRHFPDVTQLAAADLEAVLKLWEGLGYYSRARNLHKGARHLLDHHNGCLPSDYEQLLKVPGIGDYTAGAILSLAFNLPVPAVDGNVVRVLARLTNSAWVQGDVKDRKKARAVAEQLLVDLVPSADLTPALINEALIELGALVCRPQKPLCESCPLARVCRGLAAGTAGHLPLPKPKKTRPSEAFTVLVLNFSKTEAGGSYLLYRRKPTGLLAGLWDFPTVEGHRTIGEIVRLLEDRGCSVNNVFPLTGRKHIFSHLEWDIIGYFVELTSAAAADRGPESTAADAATDLPPLAEPVITYDGTSYPAEQTGYFDLAQLRELPLSTAMDHFRRQIRGLD